MPSYNPTLFVIALALFMENLDGSIISTSFPSIALDLQCDPSSLNIALTSYLLSIAVFIPISGWAADRFGARTIFQGAVSIFTAGSILCGLSSTLPELIGGRVVQGIGGAMMVPVGRLIIVRSVPRKDLVVAMAYLSIPALIGPIAGPLIGGTITTYFRWSWIFWINIPFGILSLILSSLFIENIRDAHAGPFDGYGFILLGLGLSFLVFGFTSVSGNFISVSIASAMILSGLVFISLYIYHACSYSYPLLDLKLLSIPTFRMSVYGGFMFRLGIGALPFLLPLLLQAGLGLTAFQCGCVVLFRALGVIAIKPIAKHILRRFSFKSVLLSNAVLSSLSIAFYGFFESNTPWTVILLSLFLGGLFRSIEFAALNALTYADVPDNLIGHATSFTSVAQQLSLAMGVAIAAGAVEFSRYIRHAPSVCLSDFGFSLFTVSLLSAMSIIVFVRLPFDAGNTLRPRVRNRFVRTI